MMYTINDLKDLMQSQNLNPIEFFNLPSKLSKNKYKQYFQELYNDFFIKDLSLKEMRRYYADKVFKFYIDNLEEIKLNNSIFLDYINKLDTNTKKSITRNTIKSTYTVVLDAFIENLNKDKLFNNNINYYMLAIIKGTIFKNKKEIEQEILEYLGKEAKEDYNKNIKLSYIVRKYYFNENIKYNCSTCANPIDAHNQDFKECSECYLKYKQARAGEVRKNYVLTNSSSTIKYINGDFNSTNFYDEEYTIYCDNCKKESKFIFKSKERIFKCSCNKQTIEHRINSAFNNIFEINNRRLIKPLELDFINHQNKLCIEYNGLMFHSSGLSKHQRFNKPKIDKNYHLRKTEMSEEKGYDLFHIFENEWLDKKKNAIWKSIINYNLNLNKERNLKDSIIKNITNEKIKDFILNNSLDDYIQSEINLGLYLDEELYSIISFNRTEDKEYMITNLSTKIDYSTNYSILISYFEDNYNPESIEYYSNRRYLTSINGFNLIENTEPNCFKFKVNENILEQCVFNVDLLDDYRVIFDCGYSVFKKINLK